MSITYIITKTQTQNNGYGYPSTMILYVTTSKEVADEEFKRITSRAEPHPYSKMSSSRPVMRSPRSTSFTGR